MSEFNALLCVVNFGDEKMVCKCRFDNYRVVADECDECVGGCPEATADELEKTPSRYVYFREDSLPMVSEEKAESLARKACENYMTSCNLQNIEQAKLASQKMLAIAQDMFDTMNSGNLKTENVN